MKTSAEILAEYFAPLITSSEFTKLRMIYGGVDYEAIIKLIEAEKAVLEAVEAIELYVDGEKGEMTHTGSYAPFLRLYQRIEHLKAVHKEMGVE